MFSLQRIASNTIYQIIARIAATGCGFIVTLFVAKHFGLNVYGDYAKVTAYVSIFYLFVDLGLNSIFLQKDDAHLRFRDLFYGRMLLSLVIVVISNLVGFLLPYNPQTHIGFSPLVRIGIVIFSLTLITESILYSAAAVFQRRLIYKSFMLATVIGSLVTTLFVIVFGLLGFSFLWVLVGFVLGTVVEAWFSLVYTEERLFPISLQDSFVRGLFFETFPVALMLIFNMIYFRVDMIILSLFTSSSAVGLYDVAYRVFDFLIALPLFLSNALYPKLLAEEKNNRNVKSKLMIYILLFAFFGVITVIPMWFVSPFIFEFIKPEFIPATTPLRILLLSLPIFFASNIMQWILLSKKKQMTLAWIYASLMVSNVVLNFLFVPQYSYMASAIITGVSEAVVALAMLFLLFI